MKYKKLTLYFILPCFLFLSTCKKVEMQVTTGEASDILSTTAKVTGQIFSAGDGVKHYGHCYSRTSNPTILDTRTDFGVAIGIGVFTSFLQGMDPETKYYVKAYISLKNTTVYGNEISFTTTKDVQPGIATNAILK